MSYSSSGDFVTYDWLSASWMGWLDCYYDTKYYAGEYASDTDWHYEGYGLHSKAYARYNITAEIAYNYFWSVEFELGLFEATPYKQLVKFYRPEATVMEFIDNNNFYTGAYVEAWSSLKALWFSAYFTESEKTVEFSVGDFV
jgi:hypothetical protein